MQHLSKFNFSCTYLTLIYNRYRLKINYNRAILNYEIKLVKNYRLKLTLGRVIKVTDKNNYLHVLKKRVKKRG